MAAHEPSFADWYAHVKFVLTVHDSDAATFADDARMESRLALAAARWHAKVGDLESVGQVAGWAAVTAELAATAARAAVAAMAETVSAVADTPANHCQTHIAVALSAVGVTVSAAAEAKMLAAETLSIMVEAAVAWVAMEQTAEDAAERMPESSASRLSYRRRTAVRSGIIYLIFEEAGECHICGHKFALDTWLPANRDRRHHCRECGRSCCDAHSQKRRPLPHRSGATYWRSTGQLEQPFTFASSVLTFGPASKCASVDELEKVRVCDQCDARFREETTLAEAKDNLHALGAVVGVEPGSQRVMAIQFVERQMLSVDHVELLAESVRACASSLETFYFGQYSHRPIPPAAAAALIEALGECAGLQRLGLVGVGSLRLPEQLAEQSEEESEGSEEEVGF
jgi:hypothetical protein